MQKPNRSFVKKVFAAGLAATTALWAASGVFLNVAGAVEAHPAGSYVLSSGTVWHISEDGAGRHGFDTAERFFSQRASFSWVVPANSADVALPDLGLMPYGSGVLFNEAGTVKQVSGGSEHGFTSAANFLGNGFKFSNVINGNPSLTAGSNIDNTSAAHLEGTFVLSGGTVWYITATGRKGVSSPAVLYSWGADFDDIVPANANDLAKADEGIMGYRTGTLVNDNGTVYVIKGSSKWGFPSASCFTTTYGFNFNMLVTGSTSGYSNAGSLCGTVTPPDPVTPTVPTGGLTVSLAQDTPAAGTIVKNAARVPFTKVNFTAGSADAVIDTMVIERLGISQDSNFTDIILLDATGQTSVGTASQIGNEKTLGSTHQVTFSDDITVKAGTTKSLFLAANMSGTLQTGEQAALSLKSVALQGSGSLSGSLPITGSTMTFNGTLVIGTATVAAGGQNPSATTQRVGTNDYIVTGYKVTAGSVEDIQIDQVRFYQNGTAADGDVKDLELMMDGSVIATVLKPANKEVLFKLATPVVIKKGENKEFALRLDMVDGSNRTVSFDFEKRTDLVAKGLTYGYYITPTYPNSSAPFFNSPDTTIDKGTITFSKGVVSSLNVAEGSQSQVIGAFKTTIQGEPVQVTRLVFDLAVTGSGNGADITNIVIKNAAGSTIAGPFDGADNTGADQATTTDTIVFPAGTNTYTIYANLNTDFGANDTIVVRVSDPDYAVTAKGTVTNLTITSDPTSDLSLDTITVKSGTLQVSTSTSPAAQNVIVGQSGFSFASYTFDATASGEDVRLTQLAVVHKTSANSIQTNIANLTVYDGATALSPIVQPTAVAATTATSTFSFTSPIVISKGSSKTLTLKGDVVAGSADQTHAFGCNGSGCVTVIGINTGSTLTGSVTNSDGQTMTIATSGTLTVATGNGNPSAALLVGGSSKLTVGEVKLTSINEDVDLTEIHFEATAVNGGALNDEFSMVYLFDGSTQIASVSPTTTGAVTFTGLDSKVRVPKGSTGKTLTVKVDTAAITNNQADGNTADSGDGISFAVAQDAYAGKGVASGSAISAANKSGTFTGEQFTVYKSVPTIAQKDLSTSSLANGSQVLNRFSVKADAKGDVGLYSVSFSISTTTATVTAFELFEYTDTAFSQNENNLTSDGTKTVTSGVVWVTASDGKGGVYGINLTFEDNDSDTVGKEVRFIPAGETRYYQLKGTVNLGGSTSGSVQVSLLGDNAFGTYPSTGDTVNAEEQGKFVWSDLFYGSSSTASETVMWFNGYRVSGLSATNTAQQLNK